MVPSTAMGAPERTAACARHPHPFLAGLVLAALVVAPGARAGEWCDCRDEGVPEYVTDEIPEYVTDEIPEYETGEIPEYVTGEIPEHRPRADGAYISADYPPAVIGTAYVEVEPGIFVLQRGAGGRRYARFARLVAGFDGDRLVTYLTYGFPRHRFLVNDQDIVTEHWTYPEAHTTFVFCGDRLVRTEYF